MKEKLVGVIERIKYFLGGGLINTKAKYNVKVTILFILICAVLRKIGCIMLGSGMIAFTLRSYMIYENRVKNASSIKINNGQVSYEEDLKERGKLIENIFMIVLFGESIFLITWENIYSYIFLVVTLSFTFAAKYSIEKNNMFYKLLTIIVSSIFGGIVIFVLLLSLFIGINFLLNYFIIRDGTLKGLPFSRAECVSILIAATCYVENNFWITIVSISLSCFLNIAYIKLTPAYQLDNLKKSFQKMNIIVVAISIISFGAAEAFCDYVRSSTWDWYELLGEGRQLTKYASTYDTTNFKNLFYIIGLPYTFGILISTYFLDNKKRRCEKKKQEILHKMIVEKEILNEEYLKKYYELSGNTNEYEILLSLLNAERNESI